MSHSPVLVIEDDPPCLRMFVRALQKAGHRTLASVTGEDGIRLAFNERPGAIVLDLALPGGMNGLDVIHRLKSHPACRRIPVICVSGVPDQSGLLSSATLALHADAFLRKPFPLQDLLEAVGQALKSVSTPPYSLERGPIKIDLIAGKVYVSGRPVSRLSPESFRVLCALARSHSGEIGDALIESGVVRGESRKAIAMAVSRLRRELGRDGKLVVETIPGGYRIPV